MEILRPSSFRRSRVASLLGTLGLLLAAIHSAAANEYTLKAAFLHNFCQFVEWPKTAFPESTSPIVIGIYGPNPFAGTLIETVKGEVVRGRSIRIEYYRRLNEIRDCHILFIGKTEMNRVPTILSAINGKSILTVGESKEFLDKGGMVALITTGDRVRLQINPDKGRKANLTLSSKLLRVADIYR
jgi:hypothetical protein